MIKISAISYINTIPFIYGLKQSNIIDDIDLELDYPSVCAKKLINFDVDIALVPVAIIPKLSKYSIISDFCIGANGSVDTVCLYSQVPIYDVKSIALDYQSVTSVSLLKILLNQYWNLTPVLLNTTSGFEGEIDGTHAALVIGDRAFKLNEKYAYSYDLSLIWKEMTGLPFVFAVWVSNTKLSYDFINSFNKALKTGLMNIEKSIYKEIHNYPSCESPENYLNHKISYELDSAKKDGMELFLKKLAAL